MHSIGMPNWDAGMQFFHSASHFSHWPIHLRPRRAGIPGAPRPRCSQQEPDITRQALGTRKGRVAKLRQQFIATRLQNLLPC